MYILALVILIFFGAKLLQSGIDRDSTLRQSVGVLLLLMTAGLFVLMDIWGEWLWFVSQGYESRFWRLLLAQVSAVLGGGLLAGGMGFILALYAGTHLRRLVAGIGVLAGVVWGLQHYLLLQLFIYGVATDTVEPMLQLHTSFYLFILPLPAAPVVHLWCRHRHCRTHVATAYQLLPIHSAAT